MKKAVLNSKSKKFFAVLLALVMVLGFIPFSAFAADPPLTTEDQIVSNGSPSYYDENGKSAGMTEDNFVVSTKKTVTPFGDGLDENQFEITLEVRTTEETKFDPPPTAVVLVIDISASMAFKTDVDTTSTATTAGLGTYYDSTVRSQYTTGTSRMAIAKTQMLNFLDEYVKDSNGAARWVSVVTFGTNATVRQDWINVSISANLNTVKSSIDGITTSWTSGASSNQATFTQGGLLLARNQMNRTSIASVQNNYRSVIMVTDGNPTAWTTATPETNVTTINSDSGGSPMENASFVPRGSYHAASAAAEVKAMSKLYVVGFSVYGSAFQRTGTVSGSSFTASGTAVNGGVWLRDTIATSSSHFSDATDSQTLKLAFDNIAGKILNWAEAWTVTDPMGVGIVFGGFSDGYTNKQAKETTDGFSWDLKGLVPESESYVRDDGTKVFVYTLKYKITLDTLTRTEEGATNGETILQYRIVKDFGNGPIYGDPMYAGFNVPEVEGFDAEFSFTKVNAADNDALLPGAVFGLYLDAACTNPVPFSPSEVTSGADGSVSFGKLPSGHTYYLKEKTAPTNFALDTTVYELNVSYGKLSLVTTGDSLSGATNGTFKNYPENRSLTITKTGTGVGSFEITVTFSGAGVASLENSYTYEGTTVDRAEGNKYTVSLGIDESFTFEYLPIGIGYSVNETDPGYNYDPPAYQITDEKDLNGRTGFSGNLPASGATVTVTNTLLEPGLDVTKQVVEWSGGRYGSPQAIDTANRVYTAGERVIYRVTVNNTGTLDLWLTDLTDTISGGRTIEGPFSSYQNAQRGWPTTPIPDEYYLKAEDGKYVVFFAYTIGDEEQGVINNKAEATAEDEEGNPIDGKGDVDITVAYPVLSIVKSIVEIDKESGEYSDVGNETTIDHNGTVIFKIAVTNDGTATAENVSLTDVMSSTDIDAIVVDVNYIGSSLDTDDYKAELSGFDVAGETTVYFYFSASEIKGYDKADLAAVFDNMKSAMEDEIQVLTDDLAAAYKAVEDKLVATISAEDDLIDALITLGVPEVYEGPVEWAIALAADYISDLSVNDPDNQLIEDLENAISDYNYAMDNLPEAPDQDAIDGIVQALADKEDELAAFVERGIEGDDNVNLRHYNNKATIWHDGKSKSDDADVYVNPVDDTNISISKKVSLDGSTWRDAVVLSVENGEVVVYYRVIITNNGTTDQTVNFTDTLVPEANETFDLGPGGVKVIEYSYTVQPEVQTSYYIPYLIPNTAAIEFEDSVKDDHALVIVTPNTFANLIIEKNVQIKDSRGWSKDVVTYQNPVDVVYRVRVTNIGTASTTFALTDTLDVDFFTDRAMSNQVADPSNIRIRPLQTLTFYYSARHEDDYENTVTFVNNEGNANEEIGGKNTDSDSTEVVIIPAEVSVTLVKEVATLDQVSRARSEGTPIPWNEIGAEGTNKYGKDTFVFQVTLTNTGTLPVVVSIADVMKDSEGVELPFSEAAQARIDSKISLQPGESKSIRYRATITVPDGQDAIVYTNFAEVTNIEFEYPDNYDGPELDPVYENDTVYVQVTKSDKPVIELSIIKQVEQSPDNWVSVASFPDVSTSQAVNYRIIVTAVPSGNVEELEAWEISGSIADSFANLLDDSFDWTYTLNNANPSKTFTYTLTHATNNTYINTAIIVDPQEDSFPTDEFDVKVVKREDTATVTITPPSGGETYYEYYYGDDDDTLQTQDVETETETDIEDIETPLIDLPNQQTPLAAPPPEEEDIVLDDPDVALGNLPQTGLREILPFGVLGLGAAALLGGALLGKKKEDEVVD